MGSNAESWGWNLVDNVLLHNGDCHGTYPHLNNPQKYQVNSIFSSILSYQDLKRSRNRCLQRDHRSYSELKTYFFVLGRRTHSSHLRLRRSDSVVRKSEQRVPRSRVPEATRGYQTISCGVSSIWKHRGVHGIPRATFGRLGLKDT